MNVLKRSKLVAKGLADGTTLREMSEMYGISKTALSARASDYLRLINKPWYDAVAAMDLPDSVGGKFAYALAEYERIYNVELTPDFIADKMSVTKFADQPGVGKALTKALAQLKEHILKERAARNQ